MYEIKILPNRHLTTPLFCTYALRSYAFATERTNLCLTWLYISELRFFHEVTQIILVTQVANRNLEEGILPVNPPMEALL